MTTTSEIPKVMWRLTLESERYPSLRGAALIGCSAFSGFWACVTNGKAWAARKLPGLRVTGMAKAMAYRTSQESREATLSPMERYPDLAATVVGLPQYKFVVRLDARLLADVQRSITVYDEHVALFIDPARPELPVVVRGDSGVGAVMPCTHGAEGDEAALMQEAMGGFQRDWQAASDAPKPVECWMIA